MGVVEPLAGSEFSLGEPGDRLVHCLSRSAHALFWAGCLWLRPMFARSRGLRNATPRHSGARVLRERMRNPEVVFHFWIPGSLAKGERPGMTGDEALAILL